VHRRDGQHAHIVPGVDVLFDADVPFVVEGALHAVGTETDSIRFIKGAADQWSGIRLSGGDSSSIAYARISHGHAENGGGIYVGGTNTRLGVSDSIISGNTAEWGGGVGVYYGSATVTLTNCTVSGDESAAVSGGLSVDGGATATLIGSILWGNSPAEIEIKESGGGTVTATYSDIQGDTVWAGEGNISADPMFADTLNGDYRLAWGSSCIDTGDPASPHDPDGTRADMGRTTSRTPWR